MSSVLDSLSGNQALSILRTLAERRPEWAEEIEAVAEELLGGVDVESLAVDVREALEALCVGELWDRSGDHAGGYVDPGEAAWEMFDEALEPDRAEIETYRSLSRTKEASLCYQGILKGIHDFDQASETEYKEWAEDTPADSFDRILAEWRALEGAVTASEVRDFLAAHCPAYAARGGSGPPSRR